MADTENWKILKLFQLHHKASTGSCASTNSSVLHEEKRGPQEGPRAAAQPAGTNNTNGTVTPSEESNTMELEEKQPLTELSDLTRYGN